MSDVNTPDAQPSISEQDRAARIEGFLDRLEQIKEEIASEFEGLGLGKDELLRVHDALGVAAAAVRSHGPVEGHDLNVDLAENPEDHPAPQGQVSTPINMDDNVNQASTVGEPAPVISGVPADAPAQEAPAVAEPQPVQPGQDPAAPSEPQTPEQQQG